MNGLMILIGDCREMLKTLNANSVHCCVTSPPYFGLRDYGCDGQIGLEHTPDEYVTEMVAVFREVRRVLRDDATCWINLGDSYASHGAGIYGKELAYTGDEAVSRKARKPPTGLKPKDLCGIPWRVAFALQADGWWLRDAIVWAKPNCMPGSQEDRCTSSYEMVFQLSKSQHYWFDSDAIKTPPRESSLIRTAQDVQSQAGSHRANGGGKANGTMKAVGVKHPTITLEGGAWGRHSLCEELLQKERRTNKQRGHSRRHDGFNDRWDVMEKAEQQSKPATMRNVWFIPPAQCKEAHFAVMPPELARRCILAGCPEGGTVLDPFLGSGTTAEVARNLGRLCIGIELNPEYVKLAKKRNQQQVML